MFYLLYWIWVFVWVYGWYGLRLVLLWLYLFGFGVSELFYGGLCLVVLVWFVGCFVGLFGVFVFRCAVLLVCFCFGLCSL